MLYYAVVFFVFAFIAGFFGFWGIAGTAAVVAKVLFWLFVISFFVSLFVHGSRRTRIEV